MPGVCLQACCIIGGTRCKWFGLVDADKNIAGYNPIEDNMLSFEGVENWKNVFKLPLSFYPRCNYPIFLQFLLNCRKCPRDLFNYHIA